MSNYWGLRCRTCDKHNDFGNAFNHGKEELDAILSDRATFDAMAASYQHLSNVAWRITDHGSTLMHALLRWFLEHRGHEMVVEDEYGAVSNTCAEGFDCACGRRLYCELPIGHTGKHSRGAVCAGD